jgi:hypothetical protein
MRRHALPIPDAAEPTKIAYHHEHVAERTASIHDASRDICPQRKRRKENTESEEGIAKD